MGKSFSKIRHIQKINETIEDKFLEEQLLNRVSTAVQGVSKKVGTAVQNITGGSLIRKSAELESGLKKMQVRTKHVVEQLEYLKKESSDYANELLNYAKEHPDYEPTANEQVQYYNNLFKQIDTMIGSLNKIKDEKIDYASSVRKAAGKAAGM